MVESKVLRRIYATVNRHPLQAASSRKDVTSNYSWCCFGSGW